MSRAHVRSTLALVVSLTTTACSGPPRVDASNPTACARSIEAVTVAANASPDSAAVASALQTVAASIAMQTIGAAFAGGFSLGADADAPSVDRPMADSTVLIDAMCEAMNGLSAKDIVASAGALAPRVTSALDRRLDSLHVDALQEAKAASAAAREALDHFVITSASLRQQAGFLGLESTIALGVRNDTPHPISRAYFRARAISDGRSLPWLEETFNYAIPGGLEPGESATWRLEPNAFQGQWSSVRVPSDARFVVEVVKLDGANDEVLWAERFTRGDVRVLDSLLARRADRR